MDLVAIGNEVGSFIPTSQSLVVLALVSISVALLFLSNTGKRLLEQIHASVFTNWRLALLGSTGVILSLASGWTTWDGMRNFTQEPVLSLMITFGIQGVMLIVAWLIGESFATGMNFRPQAGRLSGSSRSALHALQPIAGTVIGIMLFTAVALLILNQAETGPAVATQAVSGGWGFLPSGLLIAAIGILIVATLLLNAGSDILSDYLQAIRVIVRGAVLWVMFLACMATSVFFSFDSLFSTIFPKEERVRAAELRAQNQVAGVVNDVGALAARRRLEERDRLFETEGWRQYDQTLERLVVAARGAPQALQAYFEQKMRERQKLVAQRQSEKATAEGQKVRLSQRSKVLTDEIGRARTVVVQLTPVVEELKTRVFAKDREIVAKNAEAEAEAGGIGVTSVVGRGPKFREISAQLRVLREQKKNLQLQLREYEKRLSDARSQVSQGEAELSTTQGEMATLQGRAETASKLIELAEKTSGADEPDFDPTDGLKQLERARIAFRQDPTDKGLANIQGLCTTLISAMANVPTLKAEAREIDCDPGQANEAAERVFALNAGIKALEANCVGGDKLPKSGGADGLFLFARQCVQDAGFPSRDTAELRTRINYLELNRDDKAHRFVVTSNAFQDGNKLAYLALAIAIAIDALVFMSGLFGANAVRSPLSDVPSYKGRSAQQLEAIIDTALQPHPYETARLVLAALRPITPDDGFSSEILVENHDPHASDLRRVLNAGSTIGAVRHRDEQDRVYQVRSELFEYLSYAAKREYESDKTRVNLAELERTVSVALLPKVAENAELVLSHMHPILERHGFMAEVKLGEVADRDDLKTMRSALNAGAVYERVQRVGDDAGHYFIHADFFKTLTSLRGRLLMSAGQIAPVALAYDEVHDDQVAAALGAEDVQDGALQQPPGASQITHDTAPRDNDAVPMALRDRRHFLDTFLKALDIEPERFTELAGEAFSAAVAASESFAAVRQQNADLSRYIGARDQQLRDAFVQTNSQLEASIATQSSPEWAELDAAYQDLEQNWNIAMLLPDGPYERVLQLIVEDLEPDGGAGRLSQADTVLFGVARRIAELMATSPRQSTADWSSLGGAFRDFEADEGNVVRYYPTVANS